MGQLRLLNIDTFVEMKISWSICGSRLIASTLERVYFLLEDYTLKLTPSPFLRRRVRIGLLTYRLFLFDCSVAHCSDNKDHGSGSGTTVVLSASVHKGTDLTYHGRRIWYKEPVRTYSLYLLNKKADMLSRSQWCWASGERREAREREDLHREVSTCGGSRSF